MKTNRTEFALRGCTLAVQAALALIALGQAARADDEQTAQELTTPTSVVNAGVVGVSKDSNKAGEYDGLEKKGLRPTGNLDLRGGGSYDSGDATRWRIQGTDLGLETRNLQAEYGEQGRFRFNFGYDEILHQLSDTYQTPLQGAGSTHLTLPSNWQAPLWISGTAMGAGNTYPAPTASGLGLAATSLGSPLVTGTNYFCRGVTNGCAANPAFLGAYTTGFQASAANVAMLNQNLTDLNDFHGVNLSTKRQKFKVGTALTFSSHWDASVSMAHEAKNGLREQGVVNSDNGGYAKENATIIPRVIDYTTDEFNAALNFKDEKSFLTLAYFGELFTNHAKSMTLDNPFGVGSFNGVTQTGYGPTGAVISEEPDNTFNQLRLTAGYDFTPRFKLVADAAYGRNAQNDPFVLDPAVFGTATGTGTAVPALNNGSVVPTNSMQGVVTTKTFDLKLTAKPARALTLNGGLKYDDRLNSSPVNTYTWYDAGAKNTGAPTGTLNGATIPGVPSGTPIYGGVNILANRPYSRRDVQLYGSGDYALGHGQAVKAGVEYHNIQRYCAGTWTDCSFADTTRETTGTLEYRFHGESLSGHLGGEYGYRHAAYNANAWMSLDPGIQASNIASLVAAGGGAYSGSVLGFLNANGLTANGLPIPANAASGFTGATLATYQALFGTGNGSLSKNYFGSNNFTPNWQGLDIYNMADRNHSRVRGALDWAANDQFSVQFGGDYRHDKYPESVYGLKSSDAYSLNLDGDFAASEDLSVSGYFTYENQLQRSAGDAASNGTVNAVAATALGPAYVSGAPGVTTGAAVNAQVVGLCAGDSTAVAGITNPTQYQIYQNNLKTDPCLNWSTQMRDKTDTVGIALTKKRFLTPKLTVRSDLSYTRTTTTNSITGGSYSANPAAGYVSGVPAAYFISAAPMPDVITTAIRLRLTGDFKLTKASTARLSYAYLNLHTNDYQYATNLPANTSSTVIPSFEAAPNYAVHVIGVAYQYSFQ